MITLHYILQLQLHITNLLIIVILYIFIRLLKTAQVLLDHNRRPTQIKRSNKCLKLKFTRLPNKKWLHESLWAVYGRIRILRSLDNDRWSIDGPE